METTDLVYPAEVLQQVCDLKQFFADRLKILAEEGARPRGERSCGGWVEVSVDDVRQAFPRVLEELGNLGFDRSLKSAGPYSTNK